VGQIGLWLADIQFSRATIGYWVASTYRRRGIASQALCLISDWGLSLPGIEQLELYVEPTNVASARVAERAGYFRGELLPKWRAVGAEQRDMYRYPRAM
jgi:[ribosomal protein S5]-alanine N-acetyltransferase